MHTHTHMHNLHYLQNGNVGMLRNYFLLYPLQREIWAMGKVTKLICSQV